MHSNYRTKCDVESLVLFPSLGSARVLAATALFALGCAPRPRTEVMVIFDAQPSIQMRASTLHIDFLSGSTELDQLRTWDVALDGWPRRLGVVPLAEGSGRRFEINATARDAANQEIGRVRALSSFVRGRTVELRLVFEDCCEALHTTCTAVQTCVECACAPYEIDPRMLPEYGADAGTDTALPIDAFSRPDEDAFAPPVDAFTPLPDAAPPPILPAGALCDLEDVRDHCRPGTVCTCDSPTGCTATAPPARCFEISQINCDRPIDLTARVNRSSPFMLELDGSTAPNLTIGTCNGTGPVPDLLYIVRNTTPAPLRISLDTNATHDFWFSCRLDFPWTGECSPISSLTISPMGSANDAIYVFVEANGPSILRITRP